MRVDARNIHRLKTPGLLGLGDAQSDAARAQGHAASPLFAVPPQPSIIGLSKSVGVVGDKITVTTDKPANGLVLFNPALPGHMVNLDSIDTVTPTASGGSSIVFKVPLPHTQEFPWDEGTYDLRATSDASWNYSPTPTAFTVGAYTPTPLTPRPVYIPAGVTQNPVTGQYSVPGSPVWNGTSIIPPLTSPTVQPTPPGTGTQAPTGGSTTPSTQTGSGGSGSGSGGNTGGSNSGFQLPSFFTDETITGVPNWILIAVGAGALFYFGSKK